MFKRTTYILGLIGLAFLWACAGESKDQSENFAPVAESEGATEDAKSEEDNFDIVNLSDQLSKEQQEAFQLRAEQKVQDFADYVKIISEPGIDKDLNKHSQELLLQLFVHDSVTFFKSDSSIHQFIHDLTTLESPLILMSEEVKFIQEIQKDSSNSIHGKMNVYWNLPNDSNTTTIDVHLVELIKEFGDTEQKTVEIRLGNIY